jgi:hypothetical protein
MSNQINKPEPGTPEFKQWEEKIRNLQPEPLPNVDHIPAFHHTSNLAFLGVDQTGSDHESQYGDESDDEGAEPQQGAQDLQTAPATQDDAAPSTPSRKSQIVLRTNTPCGAPVSAAAPEPDLDWTRLQGKTIAVKIFLFDGTVAGVKDTAPPPWRYIGAHNIPLIHAKRPIEFVDLAIEGLGG